MSTHLSTSCLIRSFRDLTVSASFTLLETIYSAFDEIARKKKIFKVETVGYVSKPKREVGTGVARVCLTSLFRIEFCRDCYVAVSGVPEARKDHAVVMARFANAILVEMKSLTRELEATFGPDTGDLDLRIGIHSGPVTAGVLRGGKLSSVQSGSPYYLVLMQLRFPDI